MSKKVILPVPNDTTEGFELKEVLFTELTKADTKYLEKKAELQQELGNEDELKELLIKYIDAKRKVLDKEAEKEAEPTKVEDKE